jgi:hypothetical protein
MSVLRQHSAGHGVESGATVPVLALVGDPGILGSILGKPEEQVDFQKGLSNCQKLEAKEVIYAL